LLPPARRAGGVRPAAGPRRHHEAPAGDVEGGGDRRRRARRRRRRRLPRRAAMNGDRDGSITFDRAPSSYYRRPVLKAPAGKPEIPWYFFTGGVAGASSILSLAARVARNERLAKTSMLVGLAGEVVSPVLLVSDLGRPERFLNMLRVFKVTSPMSVGS